MDNQNTVWPPALQQGVDSPQRNPSGSSQSRAWILMWLVAILNVPGLALAIMDTVNHEILRWPVPHLNRIEDVIAPNTFMLVLLNIVLPLLGLLVGLRAWRLSVGKLTLFLVLAHFFVYFVQQQITDHWQIIIWSHLPH